MVYTLKLYINMLYSELENARQGDPIAQYELAVAYLKGEGLEQDNKQAFFWIEKSAEQGNQKAQFGLGSFYSTGIGVLVDKK